MMAKLNFRNCLTYGGRYGHLLYMGMFELCSIKKNEWCLLCFFVCYTNLVSFVKERLLLKLG